MIKLYTTHHKIRDDLSVCFKFLLDKKEEKIKVMNISLTKGNDCYVKSTRWQLDFKRELREHKKF